MSASPSIPAAQRAPITITDPASGEAVGTVEQADDDAIRSAVARARLGAEVARRTSMARRAEALRRWADALAGERDALGELVTREMGKPLGDARGGVDAGVGTIRQYAELGPAHRGRVLHGDPDATDLMIREPRGVALVLLPWNDPVSLACQQLSACLVMGNSVIVKPSERAPLAVERAVALLPDELAELVTLLHGDGSVGAALVEHSGIDLVMHTGSVRAGAQIAASCGALLRKAVVELGGKDAFIVDAGVDPAWAAAQAAAGAFANAGQICVSAERLIVLEEAADEFTAALVREAQALTIGPGVEPGTSLGPLVDAAQVEAVQAHVDEAVELGARVLTGGRPLDGPGCFYPPTVLVNVDPRARIWREETFGPVAPILTARDFDEALAFADDTDLGLAATVLTGDDAHARQAISDLDVGTVKINAAFGGAPAGAGEPRRRSGLGLGYGPELLDEVSCWKAVHRSPAG